MTIISADITGMGRIASNGLWRGKDIQASAMLLAMSDATVAGQLPDIPLDGSYPPSRRMDKYSRMGMAAISLALQDAGLDIWAEKRNIGIITSTEYGCLNTDVDYFDTVLQDEGIGASPGLFSYTLPSSFMGDAAIRFGLTGPSFAIHEKPALALTCIRLALNAIVCGDADKMLCGICHPEPPPVFNENNRIPAGAFFVAIEKKPASGFSYGKVSLEKSGCILLNGETISDMNALVRRCLSTQDTQNEHG